MSTSAAIFGVLAYKQEEEVAKNSTIMAYGAVLFCDTLVKKVTVISILYMLYLIFISAEDEVKTQEVLRIEEEI